MKCKNYKKMTGDIVVFHYKKRKNRRSKKCSCNDCKWFRQKKLAFTGKDLKKFRDSRGWTLRQMSDAVGTSLKTIQVIEKEDRAVGLNLRLALAALKNGIHPIESDQT